MIKIYIRNKWKGMVALRDNDIDKAKEAGEDIELRCEWETMTVPLVEIDKRIKFIKGPFKDKFNGETYNLVYFWWTKDKIGNDPGKKRQETKDKKKRAISKAWEATHNLTDEQFFKQNNII